MGSCPNYIDEPPRRVSAVLGLRRDHARLIQGEGRKRGTTYSETLEGLLDELLGHRRPIKSEHEEAER